jgi:predicted RNase H-like HicB family nuclease
MDLEQEDDGRWIAEINELYGVLAYGVTREDAINNAKTLAGDVIADQFENGETPVRF